MKHSIALRPLLAALLLMGGISSIHAQGPGYGGPGGNSGPMGRPPNGAVNGGAVNGVDPSDPLAMMLRSLTLTAAQKTQIQPILAASSPQIKAIRDDAAAKTDAVVQSAEAQIKPLLTPYQQQVLASMEKSRAAMQANPQGNHPQGRP